MTPALLTPSRAAPRPDHAALAQLQAQYAAYHQAGLGCTKAQPWTREAALTLGRLYRAAWGTPPRVSRLRLAYYQPDGRAILRLFGAFAAYFAALEEAPDAP